MSDTETRPEPLLALLGRRFADGLPAGMPLAGVPLSYARALNAAGAAMDYSDVAATSGWAFSFAYRSGDPAAAFTPLRGLPGHAGHPPQSFRWLVDQIGFGYDTGWPPRTDEFWDYARANIDAGVPIMAERAGGGLFCGYRCAGDERQVWFAGPAGQEWLDIVGLGPFDCCVLEHKWDASGPLRDRSLRRAVSLASMREYGGTPQGLAALHVLMDDAGRDHLAPVVVERLHARMCAAVWLRRIAEGDGRLVSAAGHYESAYDHYAALADGGPELLEAGAAEEAAALACLQEAVEDMDDADEG